MDLKGQSSVEFTMVVGMALVLSSPFIFASQSSIIQLRDASRFLSLDQSMQEVRSTAISLNSSTYPARRVVEFSTPSGVQNIYNPDLGSSSALIFEIRSRGALVNRSIIMPVDFVLTNRGGLAKEGLHRLSIRKARGQINATVIS